MTVESKSSIDVENCYDFMTTKVILTPQTCHLSMYYTEWTTLLWWGAMRCRCDGRLNFFFLNVKGCDAAAARQLPREKNHQYQHRDTTRINRMLYTLPAAAAFPFFMFMSRYRMYWPMTSLHRRRLYRLLRWWRLRYSSFWHTIPFFVSKGKRLERLSA